MKIFVGNLSRDVSEFELINLFAQFGNVKEAKIVKNISTKESKGYGFIEMPVLSEAHQAIALLNARELKGKRLTVNEGRSQGFDRGKVKDGTKANRNKTNRRY